MSQRYQFAILAGAAALLTGAVYVLGVAPLAKVPEVKIETAYAAGKQFFSQLDGAPVKQKKDEARQVIAVMIDNHPDARPPAGLAQARVVYEVPVEGPFTRYLAFYDKEQKVAEVGPVRSARHYYLDWLEEYGRPLYLHSGGSPKALSEIKRRKIFDANEFAFEHYYWRSPARYAPYNLYTSGELWQKLISDAGSPTTTPYLSWKFARTLGKVTAKKPVAKITIHYSSSTDAYAVTWELDIQSRSYVRFINGEKQLDSDGADIRAHNIIVQKVNTKVVDDELRLEVTTGGKGAVQLFRKGEAIAGTWKKSSRTDRTRFYDSKGKEIILVPGKTWVQVVPSGTVVEITAGS